VAVMWDVASESDTSGGRLCRHERKSAHIEPTCSITTWWLSRRRAVKLSTAGPSGESPADELTAFCEMDDPPSASESSLVVSSLETVSPFTNELILYADNKADLT
jgi:hypothetical protein